MKKFCYTVIRKTEMREIKSKERFKKKTLIIAYLYADNTDQQRMGN